MNREFLRDIWQGNLPLCFKLHPDDISGMHRPEPYYMMVPRITYFPLILDRVVKYFYRFMDQSKQKVDDMWLDYDGQAIKWQHPVGLSWDLLGSSYNLPWNLILHFSDFPSKQLVRCNTKASIETNFISSLKEADALKHKGFVMKNMQKRDQNQLWSSLVNDKFDQFWSINLKLMDKTDNELFRFIPFRLYFPDYTYVQKCIKSCTTQPQIFSNQRYSSSSDTVVYEYDSELVIAKSHKCSHQSENESTSHRLTTMFDLIHASFCDRMPELITIDEAQDETTIEEPTGEDVQPPSKEKAPIDAELFKFRFLSHGIEIPFDTPLQWLSEHLSYPDNFLHICAVPRGN